MRSRTWLAFSSLYSAYRAFYILNWIYRYFTEPHFVDWIRMCCIHFSPKLFQLLSFINNKMKMLATFRLDIWAYWVIALRWYLLLLLPEVIYLSFNKKPAIMNPSLLLYHAKCNSKLDHIQDRDTSVYTSIKKHHTKVLAEKIFTFIKKSQNEHRGLNFDFYFLGKPQPLLNFIFRYIKNMNVNKCGSG